MTETKKLNISNTSNAHAISDFANDISAMDLPPNVLESTRFGIVDWFAVAIGASGLPPIISIKKVVNSWRSVGSSCVLIGENSSAVGSALINGTMAHCLDFDDTHVGSISHISGPVLATVLAIGTEISASPIEMFRAYLAGFEAGAKLGSEGLGVAVTERNIHATGIFGCLGATVAGSVLYKLNNLELQRAIGLAATQASGLQGSFGTPAKPFHAGKAAFNAVLSVQMAKEGYIANIEMLESGSSLNKALVQDGSVEFQKINFLNHWEITKNTFKPYASCLLTHPIIDAARIIYPQINNRNIKNINIFVNPLSIQVAGKLSPVTPFEGKFSISFCVALALCGRVVSQLDFTDATIEDQKIQSLVRCVKLIPDSSIELTSGIVEVVLEDGSKLTNKTLMALGNPENPMSWEDMHEKFISLTSPVLGNKAEDLFLVLKNFDKTKDSEEFLKFLRKT